MTFKKFVNWFEYAAVALVVVTVGLMLFYEPEAPKASQQVAAASGAGSVSALGQSVYINNSATCHGSKGEGGVGSTLAKGAVVSRYPKVEDEILLVKAGRSGMPAWADRLSAEEIAAVVEYTRTGL